ncbi:MAG TPA: type II toxin-antitoxin system HicA family toxin [Ktedonobacterales bacterium]
MPLRSLPYHEVRRKLEAAGFIVRSQKGSHVKFVRQTDQGILTAIVPQHREVAAGTLRSILRQASISIDEWDRL